MLVQEVIDLAKSTELSTFAFKNDNTTILSYMNLGIIELYKRFALDTEEYIVNLITGQTVYDLPADYMYLVAAYEEVPLNADEYVVPIPINEENNPYSVNTINTRQVQIPLTITGSYISLIYVKEPALLTSNDLETDLDTLVNLPNTLITPLLTYMGDRAASSIPNANAMPNQPTTTNAYTRFERACEKVRELGVGITPDDMSMGNRIHDRGFV